MAAGFLLPFILFATISNITQKEDPVSIDLAFVTHLDLDLAEQDVYIERTIGSSDVYRMTKGDHNMKAQLFATAEETPHDPFNADAVGPFKKGASLGFSLGEWLKHQGTGTYTCSEGEGFPEYLSYPSINA